MYPAWTQDVFHFPDVSKCLTLFVWFPKTKFHLELSCQQLVYSQSTITPSALRGIASLEAWCLRGRGPSSQELTQTTGRHPQTATVLQLDRQPRREKLTCIHCPINQTQNDPKKRFREPLAGKHRPPPLLDLMMRWLAGRQPCTPCWIERKTVHEDAIPAVKHAKSSSNLDQTTQQIPTTL